jgi:GH25 family lysozyme M1 (1,4-beta-N-acetylmuramidase)
MIIGSDHGVWDWTTEDDGFKPIDWSKSKAIFTFLKACDGVWDTPYYNETISMARAAGKYAAPYVWLYARAHTDPRQQAEFWYSRLKDEPLIVIDFESYKTYYPDYDDLYNAIERLRGLGYDGKIVIYTGYWYWLAHGNTSNYWLQFPVWLARYSSFPPQETPPWSKEIIWQFSAMGDPDDYGITNGKKVVDENWFYGTQEELDELFGGGGVTPPPPVEDKMYKVTTTANVNIRATGGLPLGNDIGDFKPGQVGTGTEVLGSPTDSYYCLKVTSGADIVGWVYSRYNGSNTYAKIEEIVEPPPPAGDDSVTVVVTRNSDGKSFTATGVFA